MVERALGDAAIVACIVFQIGAAKALILLEDLVGLLPNLLHHILLAKTVPVVGEIFDPVCGTVAAAADLQIAAGEVH